MCVWGGGGGGEGGREGLGLGCVILSVLICLLLRHCVVMTLIVQHAG